MPLTQDQRQAQAAAQRSSQNSGGSKGGTSGTKSNYNTTSAPQMSANQYGAANSLTQGAAAIPIMGGGGFDPYNPAMVPGTTGDVSAPSVNVNTGTYTPTGYSGSTYDPYGYSATGYNPATYGASTYDAVGYDAQTYDPRFIQNDAMYSAAGLGYDPTGYDAVGYEGATAADPARISEQMQDYYNPFTQDVIDVALQDIERSRDIAQNENAASAAAAGAFGGSRQGIVEAETNRAALDATGRTSAQLRSDMFDTAAGLASQDIGRQTNVDQLNAQFDQAARAFTAGATNDASRYLADATNTAEQFMSKAAIDARRYNADVKNARFKYNADVANQSRQWNAAQQNAAAKAYMDAENQARAAGASAQQVADAANAAALNAAGQFAATAANTAGQFNAASGNTAEQFNATSTDAADQFTANSVNTAGQNNANNRLNAAQGNQQTALQAGTLTANNRTNIAQGNQQGYNAAQQFNASGGMQSQQQAFDQLIQAAAAFADLGRENFDVARTINADQSSVGAQTQALVQALLSGAQGMYNDYVNSPEEILSLRLQALGANPGNATGTQTQTSSTSPGAGDFLSMAFGGLGSLKGGK